MYFGNIDQRNLLLTLCQHTSLSSSYPLSAKFPLNLKYRKQSFTENINKNILITKDEIVLNLAQWGLIK